MVIDSMSERYNLGSASINRDLLEELYIKQKLTVEEVGRRTSRSYSTIRRRLQEFGIPRRQSFRFKVQYPKKPFSGDPIEASYLLGFRAGDIAARRHGRQIELLTSTTHPSMISLFDERFERYGRVGRYPLKISKHEFAWTIWALVNKSFNFLLRKPKIISKEILENDKRFLAFMAGYVDAEGCFSVEKSRKTLRFRVLISSKDHGILKGINSKLKEMGYNPGFSFSKGISYLCLGRKEEVVRLSSLLPLKHHEKVRMRDLICFARYSNLDFESKWSILKSRIKDEVMACKIEAKNTWFRSRLQGFFSGKNRK